MKIKIVSVTPPSFPTEHYGFQQLKVTAAIVLIICALCAWYMMAAIIINDLAGKTVLPLGVKR